MKRSANVDALGKYTDDALAPSLSLLALEVPGAGDGAGPGEDVSLAVGPRIWVG